MRSVSRHVTKQILEMPMGHAILDQVCPFFLFCGFPPDVCLRLNLLGGCCLSPLCGWQLVEHAAARCNCTIEKMSKYSNETIGEFTRRKNQVELKELNIIKVT